MRLIIMEETNKAVRAASLKTGFATCRARQWQVFECFAEHTYLELTKQQT